MNKNLPPIERTPSGSLPRMTPRQKREAAALIRSLCSYYDDSINNQNQGLNITEKQIEILARRLLPQIKKFFADEDIRKEFEEWRRKQQDVKKE